MSNELKTYTKEFDILLGDESREQVNGTAWAQIRIEKTVEGPRAGHGDLCITVRRDNKDGELLFHDEYPSAVLSDTICFPVFTEEFESWITAVDEKFHAALDYCFIPVFQAYFLEFATEAMVTTTAMAGSPSRARKILTEAFQRSIELKKPGAIEATQPVRAKAQAVAKARREMPDPRMN